MLINTLFINSQLANKSISNKSENSDKLFGFLFSEIMAIDNNAEKINFFKDHLGGNLIDYKSVFINYKFDTNVNLSNINNQKSINPIISLSSLFFAENQTDLKLDQVEKIIYTPEQFVSSFSSLVKSLLENKDSEPNVEIKLFSKNFILSHTVEKSELKNFEKFLFETIEKESTFSISLSAFDKQILFEIFSQVASSVLTKELSKDNKDIVEYNLSNETQQELNNQGLTSNVNLQTSNKLNLAGKLNSLNINLKDDLENLKTEFNVLDNEINLKQEKETSSNNINNLNLKSLQNNSDKKVDVVQKQSTITSESPNNNGGDNNLVKKLNSKVINNVSANRTIIESKNNNQNYNRIDFNPELERAFDNKIKISEKDNLNQDSIEKPSLKVFIQQGDSKNSYTNKINIENSINEINHILKNSSEQSIVSLKVEVKSTNNNEIKVNNSEVVDNFENHIVRERQLQNIFRKIVAQNNESQNNTTYIRLSSNSVVKENQPLTVNASEVNTNLKEINNSQFEKLDSEKLVNSNNQKISDESFSKTVNNNELVKSFTQGLTFDSNIVQQSENSSANKFTLQYKQINESTDYSRNEKNIVKNDFSNEEKFNTNISSDLSQKISLKKESLENLQIKESETSDNININLNNKSQYEVKQIISSENQSVKSLENFKNVPNLNTLNGKNTKTEIIQNEIKNSISNENIETNFEKGTKLDFNNKQSSHSLNENKNEYDTNRLNNDKPNRTITSIDNDGNNSFDNNNIETIKTPFETKNISSNISVDFLDDISENSSNNKVDENKNQINVSLKKDDRSIKQKANDEEVISSQNAIRIFNEKPAKKVININNKDEVSIDDKNLNPDNDKSHLPLDEKRNHIEKKFENSEVKNINQEHNFKTETKNNTEQIINSINQENIELKNYSKSENQNLSNNITGTSEINKKVFSNISRNNFHNSFENDNELIRFLESKTVENLVKILNDNNLNIKAELNKISTNNQTVELKLFPEDLGKVKIFLENNENVISAKIEVNSEQAKNMVMTNLPRLKESLSQEGVNIQNLNVFLNNNDQKNNNNANQKKKNNNSKFLFDGEDKTNEIRIKDLGYNTIEYLA